MTTTTRTGGREATKGVVEGRYALSVGRPSLPEPDGYEWTPLTSVARLESGHTPSRSKPEYWDGDIPWIGIRDATANHGMTIRRTNQSITQAGLDNSSARLLPAGTVCLSRTASVGYVVRMGVPMATSQDFVNWVCGPDLSSQYLTYVLVLEQESIRRFAHGTTHQTMYYPEAKALHALLPARSVQDAVAEVLGALDDKIAINDKVGRTAKALSDGLFAAQRGSFAERRPLGDLVVSGALALSDGYRTKRLEHGRPGLRILRAGDIREGQVFPEGDDFVSESYLRSIGHKASEAGDIVLTTKGTVGRVAVIPLGAEQVVYSPQICYFRVQDHAVLDVAVLAAWFRSDDFERQASTVMFKSDMAPYISLADIRAMTVPLPSPQALQAIRGVHAALLDRFSQANRENQRLRKLRDALLPQLMSGKIRVRDAERVVEGVV